MERANYNRGGNGGGYNRGGRNNGGHRPGGAQDGGSGENGRGTGVGNYPRGGRNRNYPQRYSNQPQEQYGGGRDGVSGRGGGQQISRTPTYPRPNGDRFGGNQEGRMWSRVVTGQPVESPSQAPTQAQNGPAGSDHQIQEVLHQEVQSVSSPRDAAEHSKHDVEDAYVPIKRPDRGTLATRSVTLLVNHFPVKFDPSNTILRYDVDVKQEASSSTRSVKRSIPKSDLRLINEKLCSDYPDQFPLLKTAYDGEKNIFSAVLLRAGTYNVQLFGKTYVCSVKYGSELRLSKLQDFLDRNAMQIPRDVLQALDVVMKANLFREKVSVGRGMYSRVYPRENDLGCGVAAFKGSQQSLKLTSNGLVVCLDHSVIPFRKRMPVIEFLKEHIRDIQVVNDISRFRNKVMCALKGLRVSVTHRRTNQKYIVSGLTEQLTRDISFELEDDPEAKKKPEVVMLTDYFRQKWDKEIMHKSIPCLKLGNGKKPNYVPMEFCFLAEDRRFPKEQLGKEAAKQLKDLCLLPPNFRRGEICNSVREEYGTGSHGGEVIQNFEVGVGTNMTSVVGRVMPPPKLKLGTSSGKLNTITVDKLKCHWNLLQGKTLVVGKAAERWALIDFSSADRWNRLNIDPFIGKLMNRCSSIGIHMEDPIVVHQTDMREFSDVDRIRRLFSQVMDKSSRMGKGRLQMIVCVMACKDDGYKYIKWVEKEIGLITQCCLSIQANRARDEFFANLGMKINAKLGGSNVELVERFPLFKGEDHFMFIGADVNHPAASNTLSPSVAAVVGSVNWPAATRYAARVSPQGHRKEEIVNFGSMCLDLVNTYSRLNGVKPNKIVVFRDGVSDGQFDMVLNKEMVEMKKAIYNEQYRPAITFVVAQKRHSTRLFPTDSGNAPPGTVVDTTIVHPFEFDFYLFSHFGGIGTSKSTHYSVIWDENGFSSDEIQKLIYHMCYIFARCTKPVSLVPPVYYADLVAYRGRMFQEVAMELQSPGSSSFDQFFYNLEHHLKDSMFFV